MRRRGVIAWLVTTSLIMTCTADQAFSDPGVVGLEARLWIGYDSNLLDISDLEQASFENGNPNTFFAVDSMSDQFVQGQLAVGWEAPRTVTLRPRLEFSWERRQYLHNAIRSEDELTADLRVRPAAGTRIDLQAAFRPQVYRGHRWYGDAVPGEPQFRPEVYKRWDFDFEVSQVLDRRTSLHAILEASTRRYQSPFEERDRESFGGGGGLIRSPLNHVWLRGTVRYRETWTRNDPLDPDDRSHRIWRASAGVTFDGLPVLKAVNVDLDLEWRRFTSTNPDDQDHFGRSDQGGEVEVEVVYALTRSVDWMARLLRSWSSSDFPVSVVDEEGIFEETVLRTGIAWGWHAP